MSKWVYLQRQPNHDLSSHAPQKGNRGQITEVERQLRMSLSVLRRYILSSYFVHPESTRARYSSVSWSASPRREIISTRAEMPLWREIRFIRVLRDNPRGSTITHRRFHIRTDSKIFITRYYTASFNYLPHG